jgi:hypothetical protein
MTTFCIDMQFEGHVMRSEGRGEHHAVLGRHGSIFPGMPDEAGRRICGHMFLACEYIQQGGRGRFTGEIPHGTRVNVWPLRGDHGIAQDAKGGA